jgi:glycosyltransferase involved in cell wall biosynthesis
MRFSIILPSFLSDYPGAAPQRDKKLIRAVQSVIDQSFRDFELIVISDGCELTNHIIKSVFGGYLLPDSYTKKNVIKGWYIELLKCIHKELWNNTPRNTGINSAVGEYIIYLDSDDRWGKDHLKIINDQLINEDWVYFNDRAWYNGVFTERHCDVKTYSYCGTSNICHAARLGLRWQETGYGHDFHFIQQLLKFENYKRIMTPEYFVCHIGNQSI